MSEKAFVPDRVFCWTLCNLFDYCPCFALVLCFSPSSDCTKNLNTFLKDFEELFRQDLFRSKHKVPYRQEGLR